MENLLITVFIIIKAPHWLELLYTIYIYRKYFTATFWHIVVDKVGKMLSHMPIYISNVLYQ